jgi:hypothetical protein
MVQKYLIHNNRYLLDGLVEIRIRIVFGYHSIDKLLNILIP